MSWLVLATEHADDTALIHDMMRPTAEAQMLIRSTRSLRTNLHERMISTVAHAAATEDMMLSAARAHGDTDIKFQLPTTPGPVRVRFSVGAFGVTGADSSSKP
jgi:hypothetical protein